jgi:hypothetical protein
LAETDLDEGAERIEPVCLDRIRSADPPVLDAAF